MLLFLEGPKTISNYLNEICMFILVDACFLCSSGSTARILSTNRFICQDSIIFFLRNKPLSQGWYCGAFEH